MADDFLQVAPRPEKESLPCENKSGQVSPGWRKKNCFTQLLRKWPSVRCASLSEGSIRLSPHARARVSGILETDPILNSSSVLPFRTRESILVLVPCAMVLGSVEAPCHEKFSFSTFQDGTTEARSDENSKHSRGHFGFLASSHCHRHGNVKHENRPLSVLNAHCAALLSHLCSCTVVAWFLAHWSKAAGYLSSNSEPLAMRPPFCVCQNDCLKSLSN